MGGLFSFEEGDGEQPLRSVELVSGQISWKVVVSSESCTESELRSAANTQHALLNEKEWSFASSFGDTGVVADKCVIHVDDGSDTR